MQLINNARQLKNKVYLCDTKNRQVYQVNNLEVFLMIDDSNQTIIDKSYELVIENIHTKETKTIYCEDENKLLRRLKDYRIIDDSLGEVLYG